MSGIAPANRFSWRTKPYEGVVLTRHHWAKDLLDRGHRPGRKSSQTNYNDHVFATKASHLDGGHRSIIALHQAWTAMGSAMRHPPQIRHMMMTTITQPIPDRPGYKGPRLPLYTRAEVESARLIYRTTRSVPGATSLWAYGT